MRRSLAGLIAAATCAGLYVATWQPVAVRASAPAPGIITTYAGGGSGSGNPTTIPQSPQYLTINGTKLYIPDYQNFVRVLDIGTGTETKIAGDGITADTGDSGPASAAELKRPISVSVDLQNNLYITTFDRVRKVTPAGIISTIATSAILVSPAGTASDAAGNLFIADEGAGLVRKVTPAGVISTVAGQGVCYAGCPPVPNGTPATSAWISPADVAIDGNGNLWIAAPQNNAVYRVDHVTGLMTTVAGGGAGCTQPCLATNQNLGAPVGIWLGNAGDFWIAEVMSNRVDRVDASGVITTVAGNPTNTNPGYGGDGSPATDPKVYLAAPVRPVTDVAGNLYIPDTQNHRVRKVDAVTGIITTVAGTGRVCGGWGDGGPAAAAMLCSPTGLATDSGGNLYLADGGQIREVNQSTGVITTVAGGRTGCAAPCPATSFQLVGGNFMVTGIAVNAAGELFFQDGSRIYRASGGTLSVYAGNGTYGYSGDGGPAATAALNGPMGIALDSLGNLFIADYGNHAIRRVDHATQNITTYATVQFPVSVAVNRAGDLFFTYNGAQAIGELPSGGGSVTLNLSVPGGSDVRDIAVGPGDRVLVSARFGNTIYMLTTGAPVPLAGTGVYGFSGDGGPATAAQLHAPAQVTLDPSGDIFIASDQDPHVRRVQAYTMPDAPRAIAAVPGDNSAKVHWYAPAGNGGLPVTQYTVTAYAGATPGTPVVLNGTPLPTTYIATGLSNGTSYTFKVTATTAWGTSASSVPSTPVVPGNLFQGYITTHAGTVGVGLATSVAQMPLSLALGPIETVPGGINTHLYVGDWANEVVRDVGVTSGQEGVVAGTASYGYSGDGGPATAALMRGAGAVAYCNGSTYIADTFNYVIRKVDPNGVITTIVGTGVRGYNNDGVGTGVQITRVFGLICSGPSIWFSDSDSGLIRYVDGVGHVTTLWSGFYFPTALIFDSQGSLYVTDSGSNRVWKLINYWPGPTIVAGGGPGCPAPPTECLGTQASLNFPRGIAIDSGNGLYISDTNNNRVMYLTSGGFISTFAKGLHAPRDIVLAPKSVGNFDLFIADFGSGRVLEADHTTPPVLTTVAGNGYLGVSGDGGPATSAQLGSPEAVAVDAAGNQYVADPLDNVVRKIEPNGLITTIAGNGVLDSPQGLAVDAVQNVYISDGNHNRILRVDHATGNITDYFASGLNNPSGLAFDPAGNLYVSDTNNNRVLQVRPDGSSTVYAGNSALKTPIGLWFDGTALYIADSGNNRVRMVKGGLITTVAGTGVAGFAGDGRAATLAQLNAPLGVAKDSNGNLYIADTLNQRIRIVDSHGNISTAIGICGGVAGFSGDSGPASTAQLNYPVALSVDVAKNLYIADTNSSRLRKATAVAGSRQASCQGVESTPGPRGANSTGVSSPPGPRLFAGPASPRAAATDTPPAARPAGEVLAPVRLGASLPQLPASKKAPAPSGPSGPAASSDSAHSTAGNSQTTHPSAGAHVPTVHAIAASRPIEPATPIPYQLVLFPLAVLSLAVLLGWRRFR